MSMLIGPRSMQYCVIHSGAVTELYDIRLKGESEEMDASAVSQIIRMHNLGRRAFGKVFVCFQGSNFTLIPAAYAGEEQFSSMLELSTGKQTVRRISHQVDGTLVCFGADTELNDLLEREFSGALFRSSGAVNMVLSSSQHSLLNADVFLNLGERVAEILVKNREGVRFCNAFDCSTDEDILYFLLCAMEQSDVAPMTARIAIAAERATTDPLFSAIRRYIRHVDFCVRNPELQIREAIPAHYYFTLFHQHVCAL